MPKVNSKKPVPVPATVQSELEGTLLHLDPIAVLADDNTRFNLKKSRVQSLADSIVQHGGVMEPVEVEPIVSDNGGPKYRLTVGFYRHAAVTLLNSTQGAGLLLPAIVRSTADATDRLKRQLAENMERENQSPMDQAIAISRLTDAGISKMDIREMFSRPGRSKNGKPTPASNSFVNMTLSFLDLPKDVQNDIHNGIIGVSGAYELTKVPVEKRDLVIAKIKKDREDQLAKEEREENKLLEGEKKAAAAREKKEEVRARLAKAEEINKAAQQTLSNLQENATEAFKASQVRFTDAKLKVAAKTAFTTAQKSYTTQEGVATTAQKEYEKVQMEFSKLELDETVKPVKLAKEAKTKAPATVTGDTVKKAAKETGASTEHVALNAMEMRKTIAELDLAGVSEKVRAVARLFKEHFSGVTTPDQFLKSLTKLIG